jgi:formamidopyrimidine-DNA glycosylase
VPEGLEAEIYRRAAARCVGRTIRRVDVDDRQPAGEELRALLPGRSVVGSRRIGKHALIDLDPELVLGLHFGMTGRLIVDGEAPIEKLEYGSGRDDAAWDRLVVTFDDAGVLRVNDPRRWAVFTVDPDLARLGPDFLSIGPDELAERLAARRAPVKALLLDQTVVAGFGNLCVDEVLWQAGIAPGRSGRELSAADIAHLAATASEHLPAMLARGGSHQGAISPAVRAAMPPCPSDGRPLRRDTIGGRTTIWCPFHQV